MRLAWLGICCFLGTSVDAIRLIRLLTNQKRVNGENPLPTRPLWHGKGITSLSRICQTVTVASSALFYALRHVDCVLPVAPRQTFHPVVCWLKA